MKAVIVYYSYSGNNVALAKELRLRFGCDIVKIEEKKKRTGFTIMLDLLFKREPKIHDTGILLKDYNPVIFIAPIWDAKIATPLRSYLRKERRNINNYAFITVCGGRPRQKEKITNELYQLTGKMPIVVSELSVNDLLADDLKNQVKFISAYRVKDEDLYAFRKPIQDFVTAVQTSGSLSEKKRKMKVLSRV